MLAEKVLKQEEELKTLKMGMMRGTPTGETTKRVTEAFMTVDEEYEKNFPSLGDGVRRAAVVGSPWMNVAVKNKDKNEGVDLVYVEP